MDSIKIDISFIRDMTRNTNDALIVRAIISMAHSFMLNLVAEGVETMEQLACLRLEQCDQVQGWLAGRPLSSDALTTQWEGPAALV